MQKLSDGVLTNIAYAKYNSAMTDVSNFCLPAVDNGEAFFVPDQADNTITARAERRNSLPWQCVMGLERATSATSAR